MAQLLWPEVVDCVPHGGRDDVAEDFVGRGQHEQQGFRGQGLVVDARGQDREGGDDDQVDLSFNQRLLQALAG